MPTDATLTAEQEGLFDRVANCDKYEDALRMLLDHPELVDDRFLRYMVAFSLHQHSQGNYLQAAVIADLGSCADDLGSVRTQIDLRIAAGQSFAQLPENRDNAIYAFHRVVELAREAGTPYMVPVANVNLGHFARVSGDLAQARTLIASGVRGALDPASEVPPDVLWTALKSHAGVSMALAKAADPAAAPRDLTVRALHEVLVLLPRRLLGEFGTRWGAGADTPVSSLVEEWAKARARAGVVLEEIDPLDGDEMLSVARVMHAALSDRQAADTSSATPVARYSTNVLTDRIISQFPYFSTYVTREALARHPDSLSILAHEFTHYWTFLGSLGGYFSVIAVDLGLFGAVPESPRVNDGRRELLLKLRLVWEVWRPWSEGLALFSEMDLDLAQSGTLGLPLSLFLFSVPAFDLKVDLDQESPTETERRPADVMEAFAEVEALQSQARAKVLSTYRLNLYLREGGAGNESCYFSGHAMLGALWRRWREQEPGLSNSVTFCRAIWWLAHSAFDDLLPDWRLPRETFANALLEAYDTFLRRLFDVPTDRLSEVAAIVNDEKPLRVRYDLWSFLRDGRQDRRATTLWEARTHALRRELADVVLGDDADRWLRRHAEEQADRLSEMMTASRVQLLSQNDCEIRVLRDPPTLVCVTRNAARKSTSLLSVELSETELRELVGEAAAKSDGAGRLHQFVLARPNDKVGLTYAFPVAITYGGAFCMPVALQRVAQDHAVVEAGEIELLRRSLSPETRAIRAEAARAVEGDLGDDVIMLAAFAERIDRMYLDAFVEGPEEWRERLRRQRLRAFLPPPGAARSRMQAMLDRVMSTADGVTLADLAAQLGTSSDQVMTELQRLWTAAASVGQDVIVRDGDRLRFVGLRHSRSGPQSSSSL